MRASAQPSPENVPRKRLPPSKGDWSPHACSAIHVRFFDPSPILRISSLLPDRSQSKSATLCGNFPGRLRWSPNGKRSRLALITLSLPGEFKHALYSLLPLLGWTLSSSGERVSVGLSCSALDKERLG